MTFAALARAKLLPTLHRTVALEGHRFTPSEALAASLVDNIVPGGTEEVLVRAKEVAQAKAGKARGGVWGLIKGDVYQDVVDAANANRLTWNVAMDDKRAEVRLSKL